MVWSSNDSIDSSITSSIVLQQPWSLMLFIAFFFFHSPTTPVGENEFLRSMKVIYWISHVSAWELLRIYGKGRKNIPFCRSRSFHRWRSRFSREKHRRLIGRRFSWKKGSCREKWRLFCCRFIFRRGSSDCEEDGTQKKKHRTTQVSYFGRKNARF